MKWPEVALGDVARIMRHSVAPADRDPSERYLGLEHIERGGRILGSQSVGDAELKSTKFEFKHNQVLYGKLRPNLGKIARPTFDGICSTDILPVAPGPRLDRDFLAHYLSQDGMVDYAAARAAGANLPRLSPHELAKFPVPLPPLDEQRRIAAILDHADSLRQRNERARNLSGSLNESIYLSMFAATTASATVEEVASPRRGSIRTGPFGSQLKREELIDEGVAVLGLDNVVSNEFGWGRPRFISEEKYATLARYTVLPGDVLISIMGTVGRSVVVPDGIRRSINTKHICAISTESSKMLPEHLRASFLWHPEAREHLRRQTKGSIMNGLNMGIIKSLPLPQPDLETQEKFVRLCSSAARLTKTSASAGFDTLFASLQARAFRGEL